MAYLAYFQQKEKNKLQCCLSFRHQQITQTYVCSKINNVTNVSFFSILKQDYIFFPASSYENVTKSCLYLSYTMYFQRYETIFANIPKRVLKFASENPQYTGVTFIS